MTLFYDPSRDYSREDEASYLASVDRQNLMRSRRVCPSCRGVGDHNQYCPERPYPGEEQEEGICDE